MNTNDMKKYTLDEIYVGMHIDDHRQLSDVHDTWVILTKDEINGGYIISFIGKQTTKESDKLIGKGKKVKVVYNSSIELLEDIEFIG